MGENKPGCVPGCAVVAILGFGAISAISSFCAQRPPAPPEPPATLPSASDLARVKGCQPHVLLVEGERLWRLQQGPKIRLSLRDPTKHPWDPSSVGKLQPGAVAVVLRETAEGYLVMKPEYVLSLGEGADAHQYKEAGRVVGWIHRRYVEGRARLDVETLKPCR